MTPRSLSLFDLQVNGFAGVDFQRDNLSLADLRRAVDALRSTKHQTERILLTLVSDSIDALAAKFGNIQELRKRDPLVAETVCGYHLEGPFLSPEEGYCGAHPADCQRAPDLRAFGRLQAAAGGMIRLVTLAPEWPGSADFIRSVTRDGVIVSLGHTDASEAQIDEAIHAGATLCTHLGNGAPQMLHRHDNVIQRLLARDELTACLIPDGIHLPPYVLQNLFRAKPAGKVILTTDAISAADAPDGLYTVGKSQVESRDGVVRQPGKAHFAGSCLTPMRGVDNAALWLGISHTQARTLFSERVADLFEIDLPEIETRIV